MDLLSVLKPPYYKRCKRTNARVVAWCKDKRLAVIDAGKLQGVRPSMEVHFYRVTGTKQLTRPAQ